MNRRLLSKYYSKLCVVNNSGTLRHLHTVIYIPYPAEMKGWFEKRIPEKMLLISYVAVCQIDYRIQTILNWRAESQKRTRESLLRFLLSTFGKLWFSRRRLSEEKTITLSHLAALWASGSREAGISRPYCRAALDCASTMCAFVCKLLCISGCVCSGDDDKS